MQTRRSPDQRYPCGTPASPGPGRPNILWITTDQQRHDTVGALGHAHAHAPCLDRLVRDGFVRYCSRPDRQAEDGSSYHAWLREHGHDPSALLGRAADRKHGITQFLPPAPTADNVPVELHHSTWCAESAIEFIRRPHARPWLLNLNIFDPHPPYDPPWEYYRRFDADALPDPPFRPTDLATRPGLAGVEFQSVARHPDEDGIRSLRAAYLATIELADARWRRASRRPSWAAIRARP